VNEIAALFGCAAAGMLVYFTRNSLKQANGFHAVALITDTSPLLQISNLKLFWIFLKVGALLYGSGYVLFAFLDAELVTREIITRQQLIDAVAVGQFTPGPVLSPHFHRLAAEWADRGGSGDAGDIPALIYLRGIAQSPDPKLRRSAVMSAFLDAVNIASVAVIAAVCIEMGRDTLHDWRTVVIAILGFVTAFVFKKTNPAFIVIAGAVLGYLLSFI